MAYATYEDVQKRKDMGGLNVDSVTALLDDAAIIVDAYNKNASDDAKKLVSCNMVIRAVESSNEGVPIGTTQATATALGYSQTWTNSNGSGELYLTKLDKKILGVGNKIGSSNPGGTCINHRDPGCSPSIWEKGSVQHCDSKRR